MSTTTLLNDFEMEDNNDRTINHFTKQSHDRYTFWYTIAISLERIAFYGIRAILFLFISDSIVLSSIDLGATLAILTFSVVVSKVIGGLLGDSIFGNKKSIVLGGLIMMFGAILLCYKTYYGFYSGLLLFGLGSGIYQVNFLALFGKNYLDKIKLLDAGLTISYLGANIGAFISAFAIGYISEVYGLHYGVILTVIILLLSVVIILALKDKTHSKVASYSQLNQQNHVKIISIVAFACLFTPLIGVTSSYQLKIKEMLFESFDYLWMGIDVYFEFFLLLAACVLWSYFYSSQFSKMMWGFILGAISIGLLWWIPEIPTFNYLYIFISYNFFQAFAIVLMGPVIESVIIQYANPKHMTTILGVVYVPIYLITTGIEEHVMPNINNPSTYVVIALISMAIIGLGLVAFRVFNQKRVL